MVAWEFVGQTNASTSTCSQGSVQMVFVYIERES
jgi:hypothetical protein